jgi:hypothetical protein
MNLETFLSLANETDQLNKKMEEDHKRMLVSLKNKEYYKNNREMLSKKKKLKRLEEGYSSHKPTKYD